MITKKVLVADRIRRIDGGFSFIPHRFLTDGFLKALSQQELLSPCVRVVVTCSAQRSPQGEPAPAGAGSPCGGAQFFNWGRRRLTCHTLKCLNTR